MDLFFLSTGFLMVILGLVGSFLPVLPGPPTGWIGLLMLHLTKGIPDNWNFLWVTLAIALLATLLDYTMPALSTKKFGGTKKGVWGSSLGLGIGLFFGPVGIVFGPFLGAFLGELTENPKEVSKALKAATGSFVGFLFSTALKAVISVVFFWHFIQIFWTHRKVFFSQLFETN
jgi:uncharacterized protein